MRGLAGAPVLMILCSHAGAQAEVQSTALRGTVVDSVGAVVAGADVVVYREGTSVAHLRTDARGEFSFDEAPREYRVLVRAPGFLDLRSSPVPFAGNSTTRFTLLPSRPGEVTVSTDKPLDSPASAMHGDAPWEYGIVAQGGVGTGDRSGYKFFLLGGHAGKVLTPDLGSGLFQGNLEYAVEVFPLWQSYTPRFQKISCGNAIPAFGQPCSAPYTVGGTYTGVSITPIMLRWNLTHGQRWMPWLQGAGGVVWTNHKYPPIGNTNPADTASNGPNGETSVWNFTPQFGVGTHYFLKPRRSLDFSANAVHISSASLGDKNPGVNASVQFSVGYSWWK